LAKIGRDAELRTTAGGEAVCNLSLAFNYGRKGEDGKTPTQWVDAALWGKRAESLAQYLVKGQSVMVTLQDVHIESFTKSDQTTGVKLAGRVADIAFAGPAPQRQEAPPPPPPKPKPAPPPSGFDDMDSDIPFVTASAYYDMTTSKARRMARSTF
jgi:single-strand DNA-binding protein